MKSLFTAILTVILSISAFAQTPSTLNYQAVIRNADGAIRANESISLTATIMQGVSQKYSESHSVTTNKFGAISLEIGSESPTNFEAIDWSLGDYELIIDLDGANIGKSSILTVPYALHAKVADMAKTAATKAYVDALEATVDALETYTNALEERVTDLELSNMPIDKDGNSYKIVKIGTQVWMSEDLKTTKYSDGAAIPDNYMTVGTYGVLYHFGVTSKVCPSGWHVPTDAEWTTLTDYISSDGHSGAVGTALKATTSWDGLGNGTDDYGFSALAGGEYKKNPDTPLENAIINIGINGYWWSTTHTGYPGPAYFARELSSSSEEITKIEMHVGYGDFSVRCIKD